LDDIAWLFNLRGDDVPYNPVFLAHALVGADQARLYVAPGKVDDALAGTLRGDGIVLRGYEDLAGDLAALPHGSVLMVDPARVTAGTLAGAPRVDLVEAVNPTQILKALKTDDEAAHIRRTMEQDG